MNQSLIIIPVHNEGLIISSLINDLKKLSIDILVIDDYSIDGCCDNLARNYSINVIKNKSNLGYEKSLNKGITYAKNLNYKYLITFDGDGEHLPSSIPRIINLLKEGYSMVIGDRKIKNRNSEKLLHLIFLYFFNIPDPLSGLKGYNLIKLENNNIKVTFESAGTRTLIQALKKKIKITSSIIKTKKRIGKSKYGSGFLLDIKIIYMVIKELFY